MARPPTFKVWPSVLRHPKTAQMATDPELFSLWVKLGIMAVERFAGTMDDTFIITTRELMAVSNRKQVKSALNLLSTLCELTPNSYRVEGEVVVIKFRNLSKRQWFDSSKKRHSAPTREKREEGRKKRTNTTSTFPNVGSDSPRPTKGSTAWAKQGAESVWPELVERAALHGKTWRSKPQTGQLSKLTQRIKNGATREDLLAAIDGFIALHGDRLDDGDRPMRKYFRATTIFAPTKFEEYVEAAEDAKTPGVNRARDKDQLEEQLERAAETRRCEEEGEDS